MRDRVRRATLIACAMAAVTTLALLSAPLILGLYYHGLDKTAIDLGVFCALKQTLASGSSFWLSSHMGNGSLLLLRPSAELFYPLRWGLLIFSPELASSLEAIIHLAIGAAATAWLGRSFHLRPPAALAAGLIFAFSGTSINLFMHTSFYSLGAAYVPLVWAGTRYWCRGRSPRWAAASVVLGLAFLMLGGESQAFAVATGIAGTEAVASTWRRRGLWKRHSAALAAMLLASCALGQILWTGLLSEAVLTSRLAQQDPQYALMWSFDPSLWPAALWPGRIFGELFPHGNLWRLAQDGPDSGAVWNPTPYVGWLVLLLVLCAAGQRRFRTALVIAVLGLLLALGGSNPVNVWLVTHVTPFGWFRYPQKYLLPVTLAASVVAVGGVESIVRSARLRRRFLWTVLAALGVHLVLVAGLWANSIRIDQLLDDVRTEPDLASLPALAAGLVRSALQTTCFLIAAALCVSFSRWRSLLAVVLVVDVIAAATTQVHLGPALLDLTSPIKLLVARTTGAETPVLCTSSRTPWGRFSATGTADHWSTMAFWRLYLAPELQACEGLVNAVPYSEFQPRMTMQLYQALAHRDAGAALALGCTHWLEEQPLPVEVAEQLQFQTVTGTQAPILTAGPKLYRLRSPMPEAFVAHHPVWILDEQELAKKIKESATVAAVLALVDDPHGSRGPREQSPLVRALPDGTGVEETTVQWQDRTRAVLTSKGTGGGLVGLRTAFLMGWTAEQAGQPLPVVRVAGQQIAAVVEEVARGPVVFRYRSPHFGLSSMIALLGLMLGVWLVVSAPRWCRRRQRRARVPLTAPSTGP